MELFNSLDVDLLLTVRHPKGSQTFNIPSNERVHIPFDYINYLFNISAGEHIMKFKHKFALTKY